MFCSKCGAKIMTDADFCQKCGAKLTVNNTIVKSGSSDSVQQSGNIPADVPEKKKRKKRSVLFCVIAGLCLLIIIAAIFWEGKTDYEATVRAHKPFATSQGLPYTYGEVFEKYIVSAKWKTRKSGDGMCVDVSGTLKGTDIEAVITIKVLADSEDPDIAIISPDTVILDGIKSPEQEDAVRFLFGMFIVYDEGDEDLGRLLSSATEQGTVELSEIYANEEAGISFYYPDTWWAADCVNQYIPCEIYSSDSRAKIQVSYAFYDYYGVLTEDKATVERNYAEAGGHVVDLLETSLNGVPARILVTYSKEDEWKGDGELINKDYWYANGDDIYYVRCSYPISMAKEYEPIFESIMDSYVIVVPKGPGFSDYGQIGMGSEGDVMYGNIPMSYLLNLSVEDIVNTLGTPVARYDNNILTYEDMSIIVKEDGISISGEPGTFSVDGAALNKNRDELAKVLGEPVQEGYDEEAQGYYMTYFMYKNYLIYFQMSNPENEAWTIWIWYEP